MVRRVLMLHHWGLARITERELGLNWLWREKPLVRLRVPERGVSRGIRVIWIWLGVVAWMLVKLLLPRAVLWLGLHSLLALGEVLLRLSVECSVLLHGKKL